MALLHEIQAALLDDKVGVGSILLKLRFLAAKLDADILEDWVMFESEGYPDDAVIPAYRKVKITYTGTFVDIVRQINNVTIPSHLVEQIAGKQWINYDLREGLAVIDQQLVNLGDNTHFSIDASNLKLLLQDKIYEGMAIVEINSRIDVGAFTRVQQTVRSKTLDFVLKLEKQIPSALEIAIGEANTGISPREVEEVKQLTQQVFYGDVTNIHASPDSIVNLSVAKGDTGALIEALTSRGVPEQEAAELAAIAKAEGPESEEAPLGGGAQEWVKAKLQDGALEAWGVGKAIAKEVITEGLKQYYGLK